MKRKGKEIIVTLLCSLCDQTPFVSRRYVYAPPPLPEFNTNEHALQRKGKKIIVSPLTL